MKKAFIASVVLLATAAGAADVDKTVAQKNGWVTSCEFSTSDTGVSTGGGALKVRIDPKKSSIAGKKPGSYSWKSAIEEAL